IADMRTELSRGHAATLIARRNLRSGSQRKARRFCKRFAQRRQGAAVSSPPRRSGDRLSLLAISALPHCFVIRHSSFVIGFRGTQPRSIWFDYDYEQEHEYNINTSTHHDASICFLITEGNAL